MSIERKIRFKAAGLYLVTGIAVAMVCIYLFGLRSDIISQKADIERHHLTSSLTNELIYAVGEAQLSASLYLSTNNTQHIAQLRREIVSVDSLIDILAATELAEMNKLKAISELLSRQASNIYELNRKFGGENPIDDISRRIQNYEVPKKENIKIITIKEDTIFRKSERKNLAQRIWQVFSPVVDSTVIVTNQRIDTLKLASTDSLLILSEVDEIARLASLSYDINLRAIEKQVAELVNADRQIASQISALLIELHRKTLSSMLGAIEKSEAAINRHYTFSIIGGIVALGLILLFILLIIYDVNKGKEAREKIRQVMESRHQLLLSVSHDIKSPLGSILGYLELREKQGEDMHAMQQSARHIMAMLENLLEFSSLEQGKLQVTRSDFDLDYVGDEILEMFMPIAGPKGLILKFTSDKVRINTDAMKIKQIVINLISNAIKYTQQGEVCLQMQVHGEKLIINVQDTGAGIPKDQLEEIYKPFTRVESNNSLASGSGYGMYVVKGLTDLLGGTINIESEVDQGTVIHIEIPVGEAAVIQKGAKKIAVFDDDVVLKKLVCEMLLELGHRVVEQDYEVILTDMEMGEISGVDILASAGDVPVILMTGRGDFDAEKARQLGFAGYLSKPFTMKDLREVFGEGDYFISDFFMDEVDDEIMELFRSSTQENFTSLQSALAAADFAKAQAVCHKMLPMFAQLGYPIEALSRMDEHRSDEYEGWQTDVEKILSIKV